MIGNYSGSNSPESGKDVKYEKYICYIYDEKGEVDSYSKGFNVPSEAAAWGKRQISNKPSWDYGVEEMHD